MQSMQTLSNTINTTSHCDFVIPSFTDNERTNFTEIKICVNRRRPSNYKSTK